MFKVEFFVDDKRLGAALLALVGIAHGQPGVTPVVNVKKKGNGLDAVVKGGSTVDRFAAALKPLKGKTITAADVNAMMKPLGMAVASRGYMLKRACEAKVVKKHGTGSGMYYTVL